MIAEIDAAHGGVDVVVANAGIAHKVPLPQLTDAKWDFTLDVDLKGVFRMARAAAPECASASVAPSLQCRRFRA